MPAPHARRHRSPRTCGLLAAIALVLAACSGAGDAGSAGAASSTTTSAPPETSSSAPTTVEEAPAGAEGSFEPVEETTTSDASDGDGLARWRAEVPQAEQVQIPSESGDRTQPAMWVPPASDADGPVPLLVVLHSFSYGYTQHDAIPFAEWASERGWGMIHPDFGGPFSQPESNGSPRAVEDVIEAIDWALDEADLDPDRVYALGFSGGGQMTLLTASLHPERFAGIVSFVPVYDVVDWFRYALEDGVPLYAYDIESSCGGDVRTDRSARRDCRQRSPSTHIDGLADADVPVYLAHGIRDTVVPPSSSARAFNALVAEEDRLDSSEIRVLEDQEVPPSMEGTVDDGHHFGRHDPEVVFARRAGDVTLVLFEGEHVFVLNPTLRWIFELSGGEAPR